MIHEKDDEDNPSTGNAQAIYLKKIVKKADVQYTPDIEDLLSNLKQTGKPSEVTHNVSLNEVQKNIDKWKQSAFKEFNNLTEAKKASSAKTDRSCRRSAESCVQGGAHRKAGTKNEIRCMRQSCARGVGATSLRAIMGSMQRSHGGRELRTFDRHSSWPHGWDSRWLWNPQGSPTSLDLMWSVEQAICASRQRSGPSSATTN